MTLNDLNLAVKTKAQLYRTESGDSTTMPTSIVDFVVEYAVNESHFPTYFTEDQVASRLNRCVGALAMACIEVYSRVGAEGEKAHSENAISRTYEGAWISTRLHDVLPNYVGVI